MVFPKDSANSRRRRLHGFTLVELLVVVVILSILSYLSWGVYKTVRSSAENGVCIGRMRAIGVALGNYVVDKGTWPQSPDSLEDEDDETESWKWWHETMEPYGVAPDDWMCPTDLSEMKAAARREGTELPEHKGTFIPTNFEEGRDTPWKWKQPWLAERSDLHGYGMNLLMPDGTISQFKGFSKTPGPKK